ncbi:hypothetical protein Dimus_011287 [Dionaea muscipula]
MFSAAGVDFLRMFASDLSSVSHMISDCIRSKFDHPYPTWKKTIVAARDMWFVEFWSRVEAETAARSSSSRMEADIWREAIGGPKHSRWYEFGSQEQASALGLTLTSTSSPSVKSTAPADAASIFSDDDGGDRESTAGDDGALHTS